MKRLLSVVIICIICSCSITKDEHEMSEIIEFTEIVKHKIDTNLISNIEYIPLETNEECLIGNISRLIYRNERFYLFDLFITNSIYVFNRKGKFIYKIDKVGKGPGEYVSISDFDVDDNDNIYVFDAGGKRRLICYKEQGGVFESIKPPKSFIEFKFINNNKLIAYLPFSKKGIEGGYAIMDKTGGGSEEIIPFRKQIDNDQHFYETSHIFRSEKSIYFSPRYTNEIYKVKDNKASKVYSFSYDVRPSEEYISDLLNRKVQYLENDNYVLSISGIYDTDNTIVVSFKHRKHMNLFISKESGNKVLMRNMSIDTGFNNHNIYGSTGEQFIGVTSNIDNVDINNLNISEETRSELEMRETNSNPVLVLFKMKDF